MPGRVDLHLRIRVLRENRAAFDAFLREAIPFYEQPGGIRVRLVEREGDETSLIEIVEYATTEAYERDRVRVEHDDAMKAYLTRWRALLDGLPEVVVYREAPVGEDGQIAPRPRPLLRTERLLLRPFTLDDAPEVMGLAGDRQVSATTLTVPHPYELHHATGWIATHQKQWDEGKEAIFAVCEHGGGGGGGANGTLVGAIGLALNLPQSRAELGYWIGVPYWGRGYATEASLALVRYGFRELGLNRVFSCHFDGNPASGRVMEKLGMKREGLMRGHVKKWEEYHDSVYYGFSRAEWEALEASRKAGVGGADAWR